MPFQKANPVNGKTRRDSFQSPLEGYSVQSPLEGDKYLGGIYNHIISKYISQFLVIYKRSRGVRY